MPLARESQLLPRSLPTHFVRGTLRAGLAWDKPPGKLSYFTRCEILVFSIQKLLCLHSHHLATIRDQCEYVPLPQNKMVKSAPQSSGDHAESDVINEEL